MSNFKSDLMCLTAAFIIGAAGMAIAMTKCKASERQPRGFVILHAPATVPGIREVSPRSYYYRAPTVQYRAGAGVFQLGNSEGAPPNGCEGQGGGFKIESGPTAGRCTGAR